MPHSTFPAALLQLAGKRAAEKPASYLYRYVHPCLAFLPACGFRDRGSFLSGADVLHLRDSFHAVAHRAGFFRRHLHGGKRHSRSANIAVDLLVVKLNPQATQYFYVRYLGGSVNDSANAIAVDSAGNAYVAGYTRSPDSTSSPAKYYRNGITPSRPICEVNFAATLRKASIRASRESVHSTAASSR